MAIFKPIHVVESKLGNVSKVAGQLIITTDVGNIYFDASTSNRILIANKYTLPVATSNALGGIKSGAALSVDSSGNVTITANGHTHTIAQLSDLNVSAGEINQLKGVVSNVQNQLDSKVNKTQTINGYSLNKDISLTANDVNAVPKTRRINGKELSSDISLTAANVGAIATDQRGAANGVASLVGGKIPENQIPTSFDEVIFGYFSNGKFYKESTLATSITGESGKIYIDLNSNGFYIYKDSVFSEAASNLKLGTTSTTAFRGDYGNTLYTNLMKTVGSATKGIYFNNGVPTAMTYAVNKDVPSDAVFVDTHYTTGAKVGASATATANAATSNGSTYLNILDNTTVRDSHLIKGTGATTVTSNTSGDIIISSTNTTYSAATQSAAGLMSASDKTKLDGIATGANKYILPVAGSSLGGVKSGTDITVDASGNVSVNDNSHAHTIANITGLQSSLDAKLNTSLKGANGGLATLDSSGHVPTSQLPSYVDDVLEFNTKSGFPKTGEAGKIYVDLTTNLTYRWSGTEYIEISPSIALGRTSSTAFPGDAGKALEDKINKTVGSTSKPVYLSSGTFTECGSSLGVSVTGNAATATKANWLYNTDTRTTNQSPSWYMTNYPRGMVAEFKQLNAINAPIVGGGYVELITHIPWNDASGGLPVQVAYNTSGISYREGTSGSTWGSWKTLLNSGNYTSYTVTKTGAGASGTWGIDISGNAATATKLQNACTINGTSFNGTSNIITATWGTARNISISSSDGTNAGTAVSVNGGGNVTLKLPVTIKATLTGNADSATKLQTVRTINGTNFDGTANITTATWGTARTITIGGTGKSVNGGADVAWSLAEIGAVNKAGDTVTGKLNLNGRINLPSIGSDYIRGFNTENASIVISTQQSAVYHPYLKVITLNNHVFNIGGIGDKVGFWGYKAGRTENGTDWSFTVDAGTGAWTSTHSITAPTFNGNATSATKLTTNAGSTTQPIYFSDGKPVIASGTLSNSISGNAATATKLQNARNINGVAFDGTTNITIADGTKLPLTGGTVTGALTVNGALETKSTLKAAGATTLNSTLGVAGKITGSNGLEVTGATKILSTTGKNGTLDVDGATALKSTLNVTGIITGSDEIRSTTANAFRAIYGNYGFIIRNNGVHVHFLLTNSDTPTGSYNGLRPFAINCATGNVAIETPLTINSTLAVTQPSTFTGRTFHDGKITIPSTGGTWITGKTGTNASINISTVQSTSDYHPYLAVTAKDGHVFNIGGHVNQVGFYGYYSGRKDNGTDWKFYVDTDNGNWYCDKKITATGGFTGDLTGNASTATKLTSSAGSTTTPIYFKEGVPVAITGAIANNTTGNAATATQLQTARTINGTSFNGTANIITATWGTARTITIGGTGKPVNGTANVAWSLAEIGAVNKAGDTVSGKLNLNGRISLPSIESIWIGGFNTENASIVISTQQSESLYHPYLKVITFNGHGFNIGGFKDRVGFWGYKAGRTGNGTDWSFDVDVGTGVWTSTQPITAPTFNGNATSATQLQTARTIGLSGGAVGTATSFNGTGNISIPVTEVKESYLSWGGKNFADNFGPIDAAMIPDLGANRFAFGKPAGVTIEYSTDGGNTWTDYGATDAQKKALFGAGEVDFVIGKNTTNGAGDLNKQLRITIKATNFGVYTVLNKFAIYVSTGGSTGCWCSIDRALESTPTTWVNSANKVTIAGWPGWSIINVSDFTTYYNNASTQYGRIRFTFGCTGTTSGDFTGLKISRIMAFGGMGWNTPSTMARRGTIYDYDSDQNVTFPARVIANGAIKSNNQVQIGNLAWVKESDGSYSLKTV